MEQWFRDIGLVLHMKKSMGGRRKPAFRIVEASQASLCAKQTCPACVRRRLRLVGVDVY